jgi:hypothetical protein
MANERDRAEGYPIMRTAAAIVAALGLAAAPVVHAQTAVPGAPTPAATAAASAASAMAKAEQEVQKAEKDRFEAMVKADAGALDRLLAPELSYTHSNAQIQDKPGFIADIRGKAIRYLKIEPTDVHVMVVGTTAVVTGGAAVHVIQNGNDLNIKIRYTDVHINRRGEWQMIAWQATRLP